MFNSCFFFFAATTTTTTTTTTFLFYLSLCLFPLPSLYRRIKGKYCYLLPSYPPSSFPPSPLSQYSLLPYPLHLPAPLPLLVTLYIIALKLDTCSLIWCRGSHGGAKIFPFSLPPLLLFPPLSSLSFIYFLLLTNLFPIIVISFSLVLIALSLSYRHTPTHTHTHTHTHKSFIVHRLT